MWGLVRGKVGGWEVFRDCGGEGEGRGDGGWGSIPFNKSLSNAIAQGI